MKLSVMQKLAHLAERLEEVNRLLGSETATQNIHQFKQWTREYAELAPIVSLYETHRRVMADLQAAEQMRSDPELSTFADEEVKQGQVQLACVEDQLQRALLPTDPNDGRNIFLEIRAGTGGDESALFAGDLFRMYARFAERQRWPIEVISAHASDLGGYREIIARIEGNGAYSQLKFESGGHRVQRVPETEAQGRIHTSACTVAILPEADEVGEIEINPADLRIDTFRASGAGGQHINKTDSAVRITHLPTGMVVECQDDRSQHKNKARALAVLAARLKDKARSEQQSEEAAARKLLVGSGDRSGRIRTYNFPQGRVTDHRIQLTLYRLEAILDGELLELINPLLAEQQAAALALLAEP